MASAATFQARLGTTNGALGLVLGAVVLLALVYVLWASVAPPSTPSPTGTEFRIQPFGPGKALDRKHWRHLRLAHAEQTSHNTRLLEFELGADEDLSIMPVGRHITVGALIGGELVKRPYTPITLPSDTGRITLLIKAYRVGPMSSHLFNLPVGDRIGMRGPIGSYKYTSAAQAALVMVAAGTGLTPMLQVARSILSDDQDGTHVTLFFQNREHRDILLEGELRELAAAHPRQLDLTFFLSRPPPGDAWDSPVLGQRGGYIGQEDIAAAVGRGGGPTKVLLCGPAGFCDAMGELAGAAGVDAGDIKVF